MNIQQLPLTVSGMARDFQSLGVGAGMSLIVHASLKSTNRWIVGGPSAVVLALEHALGPQGTLVMPTHTSDLSEPSDWQNPPVPESWWPIIREEMPPFEAHLTPSRHMGSMAECFRKQEGTLRSSHPQVSFAARGQHARRITENHALTDSLGEQSPLARLYELDGWVMLLGVGYNRNTSLHLSEHRGEYAIKQHRQQGAPCLVNGQREWTVYQDLDYDSGDFDIIGEAFEQEYGEAVRVGKVGDADVRLMPIRSLVEFGVNWIEKHRNIKS
ncbi:aminoglycoside N(3)-acetyltransferase [Paenibacillus sp. 1011MAR3C5]|uniref:aminoglycoside N(3)-acetyltransferase n=1 Tax=Paenibacillus sp. 1011MAR3C5 TaxID=1675787 RepID=UPI000E6C2301|nr:AAC(3) family N-acetyltransferase [Paenibacillus sp. 1011MAR3C5]RJE87570.1 aminoglycoside N(3)-acetyltransferase [Paenibacillus sp. 1011MAR3C5]